MATDITKYKYIYDDEALNKVSIEDVLIKGGCETSGKDIFCPQEHKKPQPLKIFKNTNSCHCHNCKTLGKGTPIDMAVLFNKGNYVEGKKWLSDTFNIPMIPNPEYRGSDRPSQPRSVKYNGSVVNERHAPKATEYMTFDRTKPYAKIDIKEYYKAYPAMSDAQKLMMIYTSIYRLAQATKQNAKYGYYKDRGISSSSRMDSIVYLSVKDFPTLVQILKDRYPKEDLLEFGIIHDDESKTPGEFKLNYVQKGGLLLVPSFDLYSDMVTGYMARPTHPPKWMQENHMKEIQISQPHIIKPLPFGLTHEMLTSDTPFVLGTEGHPDGLVFPESIEVLGKTYPVYVVSVPGTHGYSDEMLGLLRGKTFLLAYDQDESGRKGAVGTLTLQSEDGKKVFPDDERGNKALDIEKQRLTLNQKKFSVIEADGLIQRLKKASVLAYSLSWNERMGGDVNDLEVNGNFEAVMDEVVLPLIEEIVKVKK